MLRVSPCLRVPFVPHTGYFVPHTGYFVPHTGYFGDGWTSTTGRVEPNGRPNVHRCVPP
jgi:hypothetical protein